jgi:hypothetical protein
LAKGFLIAMLQLFHWGCLKGLFSAAIFSLLSGILVVNSGAADAQQNDVMFWVSKEKAQIAMRLSDAAVVAYTHDWDVTPGLRQVSAKSVPYFSSHFGAKYLQRSDVRAIALGYPNTCGYSWQTWSAKNRADAARTALEQCLIKVRRIEAHQPKKCGCRIAAVGNSLFIAPETLRFPNNTPVVLVEKSAKTQKPLPMLMRHSGFAGSNLPVVILQPDGTEICKGTYDIGAFNVPGNFKLRCFGGREQVTGSTSIWGLLTSGDDWFRLNLEAKSGRKFEAFVGLTLAEYNER